MSPDPVASLEPTSVEQDGRVYTGVGLDETAIEQALSETSFGQKADAAAAEPATPAAPTPARADNGQFAAPTDEKPLTRGQRRFSQLTSERDKAQSRAEAAERELATLRASATQPQTAESRPAPEASPQPDTTRPEPTIEQFTSAADPLTEYLKALTDWKLEQTLDVRLQARLEAERTSRQVQTAVADSWERGAGTYADFKDVIQRSSVRIPNAILGVIAQAPGSEHIQYALASDDKLAQQVASMTDPVALGLLLGRLGSGPASALPASPARPATTKAPPPVQPVRGASRTASPSPDELATAGNYQDYKATRHAQMGVKAR